MTFPFQRRSLGSLLRSWRKEERRAPLQSRGFVRSLALALLILVPLLWLQLQRRSNEIARQAQESRDDTLAIMEADLSVMKRAAGDWGHWDDVDRYMRGQNPDYQRTNLQTAALFDGGAVMVLLDNRGAPRITFADPALRPPSYSALIRCVQGNVARLVDVRSTVRLACRTENGQIYLGAATMISNNTAKAPAAGTIAVFDPLLKHEYTERILRRLQILRQELVMLPVSAAAGGRHEASENSDKDEPIVPLIYSSNDTILGLKRPPVRMLLGRSLLGDGPFLLGILMLATVLRALQMLDRRRQVLRDRLAERKVNHGIRRASEDLHQLIERLGQHHQLLGPQLSAEGLPSLVDSLPLAVLDAGSLGGGPDQGNQGAIRPFDQVVRRFREVLASARCLALQDPLTQLPNRRHFMEQLAREAARHRQLNQHFAVLFLDVDKFKAINDSYGHAVGDGVLVHVAQRLARVLRPRDFLARYGGDELAVLLDLSGLDDVSAAGLNAAGLATAKRLSEAVRDPIEVDGLKIDISLSIGISLVAPDDADLGEALRRSDLAMYEAKRSRHSRIVGPDLVVMGTKLHSYQLYADLIQAIRSHQLQMVFQPIVDAEGRLIAAEALVRWHHPQLGPIDPSLILELAEHHRQMSLLGPELIKISMEGFSTLARQHPSLAFALNLSASQLQDANLAELLLAQLHGQGLPARQLILEITEHCFLEPNATVNRNLERLRAEGIRFALDDFGTGYSSLVLLRLIRPDLVKIDKSFIQAMKTDADAVHIVRVIVDLAQAMGLELIAEGIEDEQTFALLKQLGLHQFQGFALSQPLSLQDWATDLLPGQLLHC